MPKPSRYFRISVTGRCNMSCRWCHKEGNTSQPRPENELSAGDIAFACECALDSGFMKFKLTGGEPTIRSDIAEIVSSLAKLNLPDLSMITNATRLNSLAKTLWDSGLRRLNISLNSLNPERLAKTQAINNDITPSKILQGLDAANEAGFRNIKVNFVFRDNESESDLRDMIEYFKDKSHIIVLLPVIDGGEYYSLERLHEIVRSYGVIHEEVITDNEGIRKRLITLQCGAKILLRADELGILRPFTFCGECSMKESCREGIFPLRMTYDGVLAPCMASHEHRINIRGFLRTRDYDGVMSAFEMIHKYYRKD